MKEAMKEANLPEPEFHTDGMFTVVFKRKNNSDTDGTVNDTVNGTVNANEQSVLNLIRKEEGLNATEISKRILKSVRTTKRYLKSLNNKKLIDLKEHRKLEDIILKNFNNT